GGGGRAVPGIPWWGGPSGPRTGPLGTFACTSRCPTLRVDSINKLQQAYPQRYGTVNTKRFRSLGIFLLIAGVVVVAVGGYACLKTQEGYKSLNSFSAAQN